MVITLDADENLGRAQAPNLVSALFLALALVLAPRAHPAIKDTPFPQEISVKCATTPELQGAVLRRLVLSQDDVPYVLTDRGVARLFEDRLALDGSFRPLAGKQAHDIAQRRGQVYYLYDDHFLCNDSSGKPFVRVPQGTYRQLAVADDGSVLVAGQTNLLFVKNGQMHHLALPGESEPTRLYPTGNDFYVLAGDTIYRMADSRLALFHRGNGLTALAFRGNQAYVGTTNGYYALETPTGKSTLPPQKRLAATHITCLAFATNGLWLGTTQGVVLLHTSGGVRYYASKRWLADDYVVEVCPSGSNVYILTRTGLNRIESRLMTLADKAAFYERKIRQRHIRYGFCSELRLSKPGDISSAEMIDTDNDGTWSSYYLASQAFHYAVTGEEQARANAWQTFDALERLQTINPLDGFPARTFERAGYKVSDPERWHKAGDTNWEWKAHTSSDEITAHTFAYAVLYETAARNPAERSRIAAVYDKIIGHIVRNNYYLVDVDGQPTLWGRWNPEYVNHYPPSIGDRRLNSAEIIAFLQFAHRITGKELYRQKALELLDKHGYLQNITNSMANVRPTPGFVFRGNDMGNEWNHSDDLLAFVNYWTLYRFALNDRLRYLVASAIQDHWNIEKIERNPLWNFVHAMTGAPQYDLEGAMLTLQAFPLDLVCWSVANSHRNDLTRLPPNFRHQQSAQLLRPDERPMMRWNGNPFALDGGADGRIELAGDEFLLPYWMGRYLRIIF